MRRTIVAFAAVVLVPAVASAEGLRASAEMKGCTDPKVSGTATLVEQVTPEGVKEVMVELRMTGLPDGKHAVHIHEIARLRAVCGGGRSS